MTIGDKIKYYRERIGMSQDELAKKVGYNSRSAVCKIESGNRELRQKGIILFANALGIDPVMLLDDRKSATPILEKEILIPEVATVAAGFDKLPITEFEYDRFPIPSSYTQGHNIEDLFIIRVRGDSMYPLYHEGDRILAVRATTVRSGDVAIIQYGDNATIKRIEILENGLKLIPINPMYMPETITDNATVRVIGIPILMIRDLQAKE